MKLTKIFLDSRIFCAKDVLEWPLHSVTGADAPGYRWRRRGHRGTDGCWLPPADCEGPSVQRLMNTTIRDSDELLTVPQTVFKRLLTWCLDTTKVGTTKAAC